MKALGYQIYMAVILKEHMSMGEIQSECLASPSRSVIRAVNDLVESGILEHKRIPKQGKRKRYTIKEEKIKTDMTIRAFPEKAMKKGLSVDEILALQIRPKITQRNLSKLITKHFQFYRKDFAHQKQFDENTHYYFWHIHQITDALEWITKLTLAINSGMLGDSPNKLDLARRNRERYEEYLQLMCTNIKAYSEKNGNNMINGIYDELVNTNFVGKILPSD